VGVRAPAARMPLARVPPGVRAATTVDPVEYLWAHWKQHELPNFCGQNFGQLSAQARRALSRMRRRPTLVYAFWEQAEPFRCKYIMRSQ
jgi:hypothetical protein